MLLARHITKRKRAEEALRVSEDRTRAIVDNVANCVVTIGEKDRIQSFNPAAERTFAEHRGRIFGGAGGSAIVEFASPVEAVRYARILPIGEP